MPDLTKSMRCQQRRGCSRFRQNSMSQHCPKIRCRAPPSIWRGAGKARPTVLQASVSQLCIVLRRRPEATWRCRKGTRHARLQGLYHLGDGYSLTGFCCRGSHAGCSEHEHAGRGGFGRRTGAVTGNYAGERHTCAVDDHVRRRRSGSDCLQGHAGEDRIADRRRPRMPYAARMEKAAPGGAGLHPSPAATEIPPALTCRNCTAPMRRRNTGLSSVVQGQSTEETKNQGARKTQNRCHSRA